MKNHYATIYRPAGFGGLPSGVGWHYVEAPFDLAHVRTDIPPSKKRYGVVETSRELTDYEIATFQLERIAA